MATSAGAGASRPAGALAGPPRRRALPPGFRIRVNGRVTSWADGQVLIGGAPWRISRIAPPVQDLVARLQLAGSDGLAVSTPADLAAARVMLDRGFADPQPSQAAAGLEVGVVIPAMDHPGNLARLLASLSCPRVLVVDDGSLDPRSLASAVDDAGGVLIRHDVNQGPAAARNTGLRHATAPLVAFIDSDCIAGLDFPDSLLHHFDDPSVAAVAPRIAPTNGRGSLLERYERTRSSLDLGDQPELVRPGARLGFVPSAALVVRRSALGEAGFDETLRLGEDVDLVWRLVEAGWLIRYDPSVVVRHRTRTRPTSWLRRRFEYGTSAPALEARHPGRLAPARPSAWNVTALALAGAGHPMLAAGVAGSATALLWTQISTIPAAPALAARTVGQGLIADGAAIGQLLRREWWPIGLTALIVSPRSRFATLATATMVAPLAWEWITKRPPLDPVRYVVLRLMDDAAYGSGVIASSLRQRSVSPLLPRPRMPTWRLRGGARRRLVNGRRQIVRPVGIDYPLQKSRLTGRL